MTFKVCSINVFQQNSMFFSQNNEKIGTIELTTIVPIFSLYNCKGAYHMETVVKLFLEKQAKRLSDGEINEEEYQAIIDGVNDALAYVHLRFDKEELEIKPTDALPLTLEKIEDKHSKFRLHSIYKNSFLRTADMAKYSGDANPELLEIAGRIRNEL